MDDLRRTECFIAVAEELHFGRAAARLHMSQPPLSQQIMALEHQLGALLFERNRRAVQLTHEGQIFLKYSYKILSLANEAKEAVNQTKKGLIGQLRLGYSLSALYSETLLAAIAEYRRLFPLIDLQLFEYTTAACIQKINSKDLYIAFIRELPQQSLLTLKSCIRTPIATEKLVIALPKSHQLIREHAITLEHLKEKKFIALQKNMMTALNGLINSLFSRINHTPDIILETQDMTSLLGLVGAGAGIAIVPETLAQFKSQHLEFKALHEDGATIDLLLITPDPPIPAALHLLKIIDKHI